MTSLPTKRSETAAAIKLRASLRKRTRDDKKKTREDGKGTREDGKRTGEDGKRPRARALHMLVGKIDRTLVFKTTRTGTAIAIKACRNRIIKESADAWRNELEILSSLDHISPKRLF